MFDSGGAATGMVFCSGGANSNRGAEQDHTPATAKKTRSFAEQRNHSAYGIRQNAGAEDQ